MPKLDDVISQIQSQLLKYTNDFNDTNNIESVSIIGNTMFVELEEAQEIQDTIVNIQSVYAKLDVTGSPTAETETNEWTIQFVQDHDQTYSDVEKAVGVEKYITANSDTTIEYTLIDVPSNNKITIEHTSSPSGISYINEDRGYNGRKSITWIDDYNFSYSVDQTITPISASGYIQSNIRIDGITAESEIQDYLENETLPLDKNTMFVLLNEATASKSRFSMSDAFNRKEFKDDLKIEVNQNFSLYVVIPTQDNITPREAVNYIYDLRPLIIKSLHGAFFDSNFSDGGRFLCSYLSDGGESYNKSYYIHRFDFETTFNIGDDDAVPSEYSRAFREFEIGLRMEYDDYEEIKKTIQGTIE